PKLSIHCR
ncbi:Phage antirepressor protein KilAC domain protein, partial [Haemophilus influenzae]